MCECDAAGTLRVSIRGREDVTLLLDPEAVQSLAVAAEAYVGRPAPFAKLFALDGGQIELYVRSGTTVRVSVIRNWRMPPEGRALMDAVRKVAAGARPTDEQARTIEAASDLLLGAGNPDEDIFLEPPQVNVIANDDPAKLVKLLEKNRPRWLDESEAWFLRDVLLRQASGLREPEGL